MDFVFFAQGLPPLVTLFVTHLASTHRWSGRKYVGLERRLKSRHRNILSLCFNIVNLKNRDVNFEHYWADDDEQGFQRKHWFDKNTMKDCVRTLFPRKKVGLIPDRSNHL